MKVPVRLPASFGWVGLALSLPLLVAGLLFPLGALLFEAGQPELPFFDPLVLRIATLTVGQAALSAAIAGVLGVALGLLVGSRASERVLRVARVLLLLPFGVPTVAAAMAWVGHSHWLGQNGLGIAYTLSAVVLAHVSFNVPLVALQVAQARRTVPASEIEAACSLGARGAPVFRFVIWPRIRAHAQSSVAQVFSLCAMSFALVLVLGGGPPVETLETSIYARLRFGELDVSGALACALWQLVIAGAPWAWILLQRDEVDRLNRQPARAARRGGFAAQSTMGSALVLLACGVWMLPYLSLVRPVFSHTSTLSQSEVLRATWVSLELALWSALISSLAALGAAWASVSLRVARPLAWLSAAPSGVSALVLGLGAWIAYARVVDPFEGSRALIIGIQAVIFLPLSFRLVFPVVREFHSRLWEAAVTLGASSFQAYRHIEWPRLRRPLFAAFTMVFVASLGELATVSLFFSENLVPLPLLIARLNAQYRFEEAQAIAGFLILLAAVSVGALEFAAKGDSHARARK
jgi:thiamine transport system permease protein